MFNITSYQILQLNVQFKKRTSSCLVHLYDLTHSCKTYLIIALKFKYIIT